MFGRYNQNRTSSYVEDSLQVNLHTAWDGTVLLSVRVCGFYFFPGEL